MDNSGPSRGTTSDTIGFFPVFGRYLFGGTASRREELLFDPRLSAFCPKIIVKKKVCKMYLYFSGLRHVEVLFLPAFHAES